jgi:hypothetical protein
MPADTAPTANSLEVGTPRSPSCHSPASDHASLPTVTDNSEITVKDTPTPEKPMTSILVRDAKYDQPLGVSDCS